MGNLREHTDAGENNSKVNGIHEVTGSIPVGSTNEINNLSHWCKFGPRVVAHLSHTKTELRRSGMRCAVRIDDAAEHGVGQSRN